MSILRPKSRDYALRGMVLQTVFAFCLCMALGPVVGWIAREVTDNKTVWVISLLALGLAVSVISHELRLSYLRWSEAEVIRTRLADAREKHAQMYRDISQEIDELRANKSFDAQAYRIKAKHIEYLMQLLRNQKSEVDHLIRRLEIIRNGRFY